MPPYRVVFVIGERRRELQLSTHNILSIEPDDSDSYSHLDAKYVLAVVPRSKIKDIEQGEETE